MTAFRRAVIVGEWILIGGFAFLLVFLLLDLPSAWFAQPCSIRPSVPNCYPWGSEGPAADAWNYSSKHTYLASVFYDLGAIAIGLSALIWLSAGRRILVLLAALTLLCADRYIVPLML